MSFTVDITTQINVAALAGRVNNNEFGLFLATAAHKHFYPAMPYQTGSYANMVNIRPWEYEHVVPYAGAVYNTNRNFRKDKHPMAMSRYVKGYGHIAIPKITQVAQNYINSKGVF